MQPFYHLIGDTDELTRKLAQDLVFGHISNDHTGALIAALKQGIPELKELSLSFLAKLMVNENIVQAIRAAQNDPHEGVRERANEIISDYDQL